MIKTFSKGGIHPHDSKIAKDSKIEVLPLPKTVYISVSQNLGAPSKPIVKAGDIVKVGQVIAEPTSFVSSYVHSSVSGVVKSVGPRRDLKGNNVVHIEIEVDGDEWLEDIDRTDTLITDIPKDNDEILKKIKEAGVVGLGGATFPTHVKLSPPPGKKADFLIINGSECEPYLTSDYRIMLERGKEVVIGTALMKQVLGCPAIIGIEENKPEAVKSINQAIDEFKSKVKACEDISVQVLKKKYPQGGEKQLIDAILKRQVKSMTLPIDSGAVVQNAGTALAVYEAVQKNKPLITNTLTVTGDCVPESGHKNYLFRIGVPFSFIAEQIGGIPASTAKLVSGGPMMGWNISNFDAAVVKGTSSLLFLTEDKTKRQPETACIRCGKCADACPMGLEPFLLNKYGRLGMMEELEENAVYDCIECGCCSYVCPAHIPLLDTIRIVKGDVIKLMRSRNSK